MVQNSKCTLRMQCENVTTTIQKKKICKNATNGKTDYQPEKKKKNLGYVRTQISLQNGKRETMGIEMDRGAGNR